MWLRVRLNQSSSSEIILEWEKKLKKEEISIYWGIMCVDMPWGALNTTL